MATKIQIDNPTKERLKTFGLKGETYQDIINRLIDIAIQQRLHEFLTSKNAIPIGEAIRRHKKKWSL